jgi:hypothetical protein
MQEQHEKAAGASCGNGLAKRGSGSGRQTTVLSIGDGDTIRVRQAG